MVREITVGMTFETILKEQLGLQLDSQVKTILDFLQHHPRHSLIVLDGAFMRGLIFTDCSSSKCLQVLCVL